MKERIIFMRERDANLRVGAYFASKLLVLTLMSVAQSTLLFGLVRAWCDPPGSWSCQWFTLAALATSGTAFGLLISAVARTEEVATALVPIAVLPQIILGGVIAPLSGVARWLSDGFVSVARGQEALERLLIEAGPLAGEPDAGSWWGPLPFVLAQAAAASAAALVSLRTTRGGRRRSFNLNRSVDGGRERPDQSATSGLSISKSRGTH